MDAESSPNGHLSWGRRRRLRPDQRQQGAGDVLGLRSGLAALALGLAAPLAAGTVEGELSPMPVWPQGVPSMKGWPGLAKQSVQEEARDGGETIWNVTAPTLQPFLPDPAISNGLAVVIAPGGGFRLLALHHEGTRVARWLSARGVAAFVLKYRLIQSPPGESNAAMRKRVQETLEPGIGGNPGTEDAIEALRIVRTNAAQWRIDPDRVGILGFSAGGHIAGMSMFAARAADRPAFVGLIYGFPFGKTPPAIPPANMPYPPETPKEIWLQPKPIPAPGRLPPMFLAMAQDDLAVGVGFRSFYDQLFAAGYRPELHLYERGDHGFGMSQRGTTADRWVEQFALWLDTEIKGK